MALGDDFKTFCKSILLDNRSDMEKTAAEIAKKLNKHYYELDSDPQTHMYIVGSVGRRTAIKDSSDLDIIFVLPHEVYAKYNNYTSRGQSSLLQDVKEVIKERYPRTDISGDGQVVVISFNKYTVELVPAFQNSDGSFTYPDTNNGGTWKKTDPIPEQETCWQCNKKSNGIYFDFCHIIRAWKNNNGVSMGGLLIDTLLYNHFSEKGFYNNNSIDDYYTILTNIFEYFKNQRKDRVFWYAVGSNQLVNNSDNSAFVGKAEKAYNQLSATRKSSSEANDVLINILGSNFPVAESKKNATYAYDKHAHMRGASTEQFIDELFPVDIRYSLSIDCKVTQKGFRPCFLSEILREHKWLSRSKQLDFQIVYTTCKQPYSIYWKVRNVGEIAKAKGMIRGEICCTNNPHQKEHTDFYGPHFVECYLVKDGVCVAKARIDVPIEVRGGYFYG